MTVETGVRGGAYAVVPPTAIALYPTRPEGSPRNVWRTTITGVDRLSDRTRVSLGAPLPLTAELTAGGFAALDRQVGDEIWASVKATEITTYPA